MFSYQSSLFLSQRQLIYNIISISLCQQFFHFCFKSRCHHRSLEGGCPDDKWYLTTSIQNCQCCFYYFFNSEYSDTFFRYLVIHFCEWCSQATHIYLHKQHHSITDYIVYKLYIQPFPGPLFFLYRFLYYSSQYPLHYYKLEDGIYAFSYLIYRSVFSQYQVL